MHMPCTCHVIWACLDVPRKHCHRREQCMHACLLQCPITPCLCPRGVVGCWTKLVEQPDCAPLLQYAQEVKKCSTRCCCCCCDYGMPLRRYRKFASHHTTKKHSSRCCCLCRCCKYCMPFSLLLLLQLLQAFLAAAAAAAAVTAGPSCGPGKSGAAAQSS
jgi:hypothetical protein